MGVEGGPINKQTITHFFKVLRKKEDFEEKTLERATRIGTQRKVTFRLSHSG